MIMKNTYVMHSKIRERLGFGASLIIHFLLFIVLSVSGMLLPQAAVDEATDVTFFAAGGGGGGGGGSELELPGSLGMTTSGQDGGDALALAQAEVDQAMQDADGIIDSTDGTKRADQQALVAQSQKNGSFHKQQNDGLAAAARGHGSGTGSGGGHGSGSGTGTGSGTGPGSGSGSGGGHGSGHGTGIGSGSGLGNGIWRQPAVPPRITATVAPSYPPGAKQAGVEGVTLLQLVIGVDGRVESAVVLRSSGDNSLDGAAVSAAKGWRFTAARSSTGQKVRCYYNLPMRFSLRYQ